MTGKCVVLGVTGGIAAYKACELTSILRKKGACVRVVLTKNACEFVMPKTFEAISGNPAYDDLFARASQIAHIELARQADLMIVAPATANLLAKAAVGIADDLLSTTVQAMRAPMLFAPAMNAAMWRSPATQQNVRVLRDRGVTMIGPETGHLACGTDDVGRMSEPADIASAAEAILFPRRDFAGKNLLVTAGPTRERLDPVRFLTNRSSGRMGFAIARAAAARGAKVTLVTGPVGLETPVGVERVEIESTADLFRAVTERFAQQDCVIQAAAPADFTPEEKSDGKIKKTGAGLTLRLVPTPDVAAAIGAARREDQVLVAFAAETDDLLCNAREKLLRKNADLVVANDVTAPGAGFGVDTNIITLVTREGEEALPLLSKDEAANRILDCVAGLFAEK